MEKSGEFALPSPAYPSQRAQATAGAAVENHTGTNAVRMFPADKPSHLPISSGNFQPVSSIGLAAPQYSAPLPYQLPSSELKPIVSAGLPSAQQGIDSSSVVAPRVDRSHFRLEGRPNGSAHTQILANSSGNHSSVKTPTWSVQPQSISTAKSGPENKVPTPATAKAEGAMDVNQVPIPKPFITQAAPTISASIHQHIQSANFVQAPSLASTHTEIGKIVQKFLQSRTLDNPAWIPPSRDYMNKALTCQMCKSPITEVDNALVCDACEKGFHMKCLQASNIKGVPRGEWHCGRCLSLGNGKPLPPKYGRVMRNINPTKVASGAATNQISLDRKMGTIDEKAAQPNLTANGNATLPNPAVVVNGDHELGSRMTSANLMQGSEHITGEGTMDDKSLMGIGQDDSLKTSSNAPMSSSPIISHIDQEKGNNKNAQPPGIQERLPCSSNVLQDNDHICLPKNINPLSTQSQQDVSVDKDLREACGEATSDEKLDSEPKQVEREAPWVNCSESSTASTGNMVPNAPSVNSCQGVDWIGDILNIAGERSYYQSCRVNGLVYKARDYVLVRLNQEKLIPSKLQAMWEDRRTGLKWIDVNRCYFPNDLPEAVGRPCGLESNEVYESSTSITLMAGSIEGSCEVLPPNKFIEERERRTHRWTGKEGAVQHLYLCKWIYDESKRLFRDVSC